MTLFEELKWRGLIKDISSPEIENLLNNKKITFYWGTDPSADSLHLGHYSSLVTAKRLANAGHHPILLVGGATGLIGDPRPTSEREIIDKDTASKNLRKIAKQVRKIFNDEVEVVNNFTWTRQFTLIDFLRDIGKYINVNYMLNKDIIKRRLETGITYAEFSYTLIQGNDFLHLFENYDCILQVEGSDQWGNITTGIELIKKKLGKEAYGFTMPLIVDKQGKKFGKSEGNALWLDLKKTSSYELYQYLINTDDELVIHYLKVFTFLTKEEIEALEQSNQQHPELREAHKALAREIITDLHGAEEYEKAVKISENLFSGNIRHLETKDILLGLRDVPHFTIKEEKSIVDILVENGICSSKREAREFIANKAIMLNGKTLVNSEFVVTKKFALNRKYLIVRRGKKKFFVGEFSE